MSELAGRIRIATPPDTLGPRSRRPVATREGLAVTQCAGCTLRGADGTPTGYETCAGYAITHIASGHSVGTAHTRCLPLPQALHALELLAPLVDWTLPQEALENRLAGSAARAVRAALRTAREVPHA